MTTNEIDDKPIESNLPKNFFNLNHDIQVKNECLCIPICININDEEVEISKNLDRY